LRGRGGAELEAEAQEARDVGSPRCAAAGVVRSNASTLRAGEGFAPWDATLDGYAASCGGIDRGRCLGRSSGCAERRKTSEGGAAIERRGRGGDELERGDGTAQFVGTRASKKLEPAAAARWKCERSTAARTDCFVHHCGCEKSQRECSRECSRECTRECNRQCKCVCKRRGWACDHG